MGWPGTSASPKTTNWQDRAEASRTGSTTFSRVAARFRNTDGIWSMAAFTMFDSDDGWSTLMKTGYVAGTSTGAERLRA